MLVWDEASEQVIDRIEMKHQIPNRITMNESKTRLYVVEASGQNVEIVDIASRDAIHEFTLSHDSVSVRIDGIAPHPSDERAILFVKRYTKQSDRYTVEGPFLLDYDIASGMVTDTIPWPGGEGRNRASFRYAPDGETLYFFTDDIIAVDADTYEEVDRWDVSAPLEPGLGALNFGTNSATYDEPGVATSLYRMRDPVHNTTLMGIATVRLSEKEIDFYTLGPSEPVSSFVVAPDGRKGYGLYTTVGLYEFWEFDLVERRVTGRHAFEGRPRMGLEVSADGTKLYIHVAGNTIDVYDSESFELLRTVEFDVDMTLGNVAIIPGGIDR